MNNNIPIGLEDVFHADSIEEMLNSLHSLLEKIHDTPVIASDSVSTPIGQYFIETAEDCLFGGFCTVIAVEKKNGEKFGPVCVSGYKTLEEAEKEHRAWRNSVIEFPPAILRDIREGDIIIINPEQ